MSALPNKSGRLQTSIWSNELHSRYDLQYFPISGSYAYSIIYSYLNIIRENFLKPMKKLFTIFKTCFWIFHYVDEMRN